MPIQSDLSLSVSIRVHIREVLVKFDPSEQRLVFMVQPHCLSDSNSAVLLYKCCPHKIKVNTSSSRNTLERHVQKFRNFYFSLEAIVAGRNNATYFDPMDGLLSQNAFYYFLCFTICALCAIAVHAADIPHCILQPREKMIPTSIELSK